MNTGLLARAKEVLENNFQHGGFTIPSKGLYPFQWKWDSGFIALGFAHFDMDKAKKEIETLLKAQWDNGFIPHIVFHNESDTYFPGPDFHQSKLSPLSRKDLPSTGMTQPPVFGFVLEHMYLIAKDKADVLAFIDRNIDAIFRNHQYFYNNRDINNEGLVYIYHNWESGTDNSPIWDDIWSTMNPPEYNFERRDTTHVDPEQRPTKREYDHYLHIIDIAKKYNYDDELIAKNSPFLVQDPLFNAILIESNSALSRLYALLGRNEDFVNYLIEKNAQSINAMNTKLYNKKLGGYFHYDLKADKQIEFLSSSSFAPLFADAPDEKKVHQMVKTMLEKFGGEDKYLCASFDPTNQRFNPRKYWRGPVWINLNWILFQGLKKHGFYDVAERVKSDSIELIQKNGFYEYFDCRINNPDTQNSGYGGNNFSWSAALLIDFLERS